MKENKGEGEGEGRSVVDSLASWGEGGGEVVSARVNVSGEVFVRRV